MAIQGEEIREVNPRCGYKCTGRCCKFTLVPLVNEDHARWAFYHGLKVYKRSDGEWRALVEGHPCSKLTKDSLCGVYGTGDRPKMCGEYWCEEAPEYEEVTF